MQNRNEVIISIKPKWCDLIVSGKKTDEIRKTKPDTSHGPLRVLIYKSNRGKVIGEFTLRTCRFIQAWTDKDGEKHIGNTIGLRHCMDDEELFTYIYIEDLIVYDEAKRLDWFCGLKRPPQSWQYGVI